MSCKTQNRFSLNGFILKALFTTHPFENKNLHSTGFEPKIVQSIGDLSMQSASLEILSP